MQLKNDIGHCIGSICCSIAGVYIDCVTISVNIKSMHQSPMLSFLNMLNFSEMLRT